ncbi:myosin phosphatase Rho-interacting protein-like isoform X2 [Paralichthys olivaceus]|uniref:myosin phosphatase Rho-interacting protein-like isoform X2 n=1 Tax=Paralichthys olivaceus TaxID=8255 RepID=UPI00375301FC
MSGEKASSPCNKFQANIFNKSKCQNCFKSRELHLMSDHDQEQAKPIYGGWLCLAPEGTDFNNPMQRSRKWQRRFFILYEHGSLRYALDELSSTLPQGTVNLNLCTDIADAEPRTGQRNALCIVTSEQEIFIRGDNKELINGWSEQLSMYLRTNKQNQKKKRKVEPVTTQEPSPAKMAATDPAESSCGWWQEEQRSRGPDVTPIWTVTDPEQTPADTTSAFQCSVSRDPLTLDAGFGNPVFDSTANGNIAQLVQASANSKDQSQDRSGGTTERIVGLDTTNKEQEGRPDVSSRGRSEARNNKREKLHSCGDVAQLSAPPPQRRAKSLDRRTSETVMTPDLLNFKKGWMVKLDENDQWKKYWFVLSIDSLRFYKDSITEEASDLEGEIDLTRCYNVSEYQVQRNYGFQIHTLKAVYTLSAMTAGIRRNWIQSLMKNVHPANAPDVTSLPGHHPSRSALEALPKPDVTQDSCSTDVSTERDPHHKPRSVMEKRREGRYKTYDWAEFRPQKKSTPESDRQRITSPCSLELGDLDRRRRREERRRRYENMLGFSLSWDETGGKTDNDSVRALSPKSQQRVEEEIEECWKQVEKTVFRPDRTVPLFTEAEDTVEMQKLLNSYRNGVEDLKLQLAESERHRLELEAQLSPVGDDHQQVKLLAPPLGPEEDLCPSNTDEDLSNSLTLSLKEAYEDTREVSQQQNIITHDVTEQFGLEPPSSTPQQTPSIWLHDTDGNFQELGDFLPEGVATPLFSPTSDSQYILSHSEGQMLELNSDGTTADHQKQLENEDSPLCPTTETQKNNTECNSNSFILGMQSEGDDSPVNCLVEQHIPPDQAMVRKLSQEVELLTSQNEALNQRSQEMLNQLTEADREIERLKAELSSRYTEPHHLPEVEQQEKMRAEDLERELSLRNQELLEAQTLITSLMENLRGTEAMLQLNVNEEEAGGEKKDLKPDGYLLRCFEVTEAKLTELERQLVQSETHCEELQVQNAELKEGERRFHQRAAEAEADIRRLNQELEAERFSEEKKSVSGEERIRQVIEGMVVRLDALEKLLEAIGKLDYWKERENDETMPAVLSQLKWEENFWILLLNEFRASTSQSNEEKCVEVLLREVAEHMVVERQMLLLGHYLLSGIDSYTDEGREGLKDLDVIWNTAGVTVTETQKTNETRMFDSIDQLCPINHFKATTQMKMSLLNCVASAPEKLQLMAERCRDFQVSEHHWFGLIHSAATEALYCCHLKRLQSKCDKELEETKRKLLNCSNCVKLIEENRELKARLSNLEEQQLSTFGDKRNMCCQTDEISPQDTGTELQITQAGIVDTIGEEEMVKSSLNFTDVPLLGTQEMSKENSEDSDESQQESDPNTEMEQVLVLRRRERELEELLSVTVEEMSQEFEGKMAWVQMQHEKETEKLKATCQQGFVSMEQSHLKVVEELQHRHQQEVERLLVERDQLLEEESAATATAITAIKNAHRLELEREVQRRSQSENSNENIVLQDMHRLHSEELASYQRELEVLSQQFSLKCLENRHLVQAVDAERRALCQCQQENQDLRTRNQELSGHLAAEITRLCSLAKQDELPFRQGMDIYEMEITLRVKESEVQCLKQEITSLKDELQSAQRDKRNATKKYKDMFTELSIVRAKTDREVDELRENLRLAHQALDQTSP